MLIILKINEIIVCNPCETTLIIGKNVNYLKN